MTTSGSYSFSLVLNSMLLRAYQLINVYGSDQQTLKQQDYNYAIDIFNAMIVSWSSDGIHLWKRRQATLFPAYTTPSYAISNTGWHCTNTYSSTTINGTASTSATTLTVVSTTGMNPNDFIGIEMSDGTRYWTTIVSITNGTTLVIANALTQSSALNGTVINYTTKINRPLRILRATTKSLSTGSEVMMAPYSYDQYFNTPVKSSLGTPNNFYYDKLLNNGTLYVYPSPSTVDTVINFTYDDAFQNFVNSSDNADFPQEWTYPLILNLACELAIPYGKFTELQQLQPKADKYKDSLTIFDSDEEDLIFSIKNN